MANILVADDDPDLRLLLNFHLAGEGHDVSVCSTGDDVMPMLEARNPDLLLLDLMMPGLNGYQVLEAMQPDQWNEKVRIIVLTARTSATDRERAYSLGAHVFMTKPFDPDELLGVVNETLEVDPRELSSRVIRDLARARTLQNP